MKAGKSPKRARAESPSEEAVSAAPESSGLPLAAPQATERGGADAGAVVLLPDCTARNAEALKSRLLEFVQTQGTVEVEVGAVERVDTVCLQLLSAFVRERTLQGATVAWRGHSDALEQAAVLLGLDGTLAIRNAA